MKKVRPLRHTTQVSRITGGKHEDVFAALKTPNQPMTGAIKRTLDLFVDCLQ